MFYGTLDIGRNALGMSSRSGELRKAEFWALHNASFDLKKGEILGIIGPNGSGKTTLLKMINGIFWPDAGRITVRGRVGALIAVGAGFHPLLTGRENIYLNAAILGMSREEVDEKFEDIVAFADIGDFLGVPVKNYSSGMFVRLGFSVAIHCRPDILLVDEILAVGDLAFQRKCFERIDQLRNSGVTILMVSHSIRQIQRLATRVIMLSKGHLVTDGNPKEVTQLYAEKISESRLTSIRKDRQIEAGQNVMGTGEITVTSVKTLDSSGREASSFQTGDHMAITASLDSREPAEAIVGISIFTTDFIRVCNVKYELGESDQAPGGKSDLKCILPDLPLLPGEYLISMAIKASNNRIIFRGDHLAEFAVKPGKLSQHFDGLVYIQPVWEYKATPGDTSL